MFKTLTKDMTSGSPVRLLLAFGIPMFLGNIFQQFYSIVDTAVVGRGIGVDALAAVGATGSINWLVMGFITGLTHGFSILMSQNFGKGDSLAVKKSVTMSIYLSLIVSVIVSVFGTIFSRPMLEVIETPTEILDDATVYLAIMFAGTLASILYNITSSILRAFGNSTTPLVVVVIVSVINVGLDCLFVLVFNWGVAGAAVATVLAQLICGVMCLFAVIKIPMLAMTKEDWKWDKAVILQLMKLGLPVGIMNSVTAVGMLMLQKVVNTLGAVTVAAYTVGMKIVSLADQASCIIGVSLGTFVGQNLGAGLLHRTRDGVKKGAVLSIGFSAVVAAILIFLGRPLTSFFVSPEEIYVIDAAYPYLFIGGAMMWSLGLLFVFRYSLQGLGDTVVPLFSGVFELAIRLSLVLLLPESLGFYRICIAEVSAWFGAMVMLGISYFIRVRKIDKSTPTTDRSSSEVEYE